MFSQREKYIKIDDKLVDYLFLTDCKILKLNEEDIKNELDYFYIKKYPNITDADYISKKYYQRLKKNLDMIFSAIHGIEKPFLIE